MAMMKEKARRTASEKFQAADWHRGLIDNTRYKPGGSSVPGRSIDEEASSDRARVLYSSAFRRLQHKTQVFTLSKDAAVRSRLTHSLEVASVGRWIAQKVVDRYLQPSGLEQMYCSAFISLIETGCLAHDIGNPPFGHFGESAIKEWFRDKWPSIAANRSRDPKLQKLTKDFLSFDGNPQGLRVLTRLQGRTQSERRDFGMNLTYSQILTALKYPRGPLDTPRWKKAGFFESERSKIETAWKHFDFDSKSQRRFPLAYLVEAADDISYCIGDMEDGIDQGIITPGQVFAELSPWIVRTDKAPTLADLREILRDAQEKVISADLGGAKDLFTVFKTSFTAAMIEECALAYGDGSAEDIQTGTREGLLDHSDAEDLLEILKSIARRFLYPADRVQRPFLAGLRVIHGILDEYGRILFLTQEQFALLRESWRAPDRRRVSDEGLETLLPLLDNLPPHYLDVYDSSVADNISKEKWGRETWELFCRAHLILDYLSGMTDDFAFHMYQVISGGRLD